MKLYFRRIVVHMVIHSTFAVMQNEACKVGVKFS